ncbi:MAG: Asd/ArgC dimerization domain-containing protein [Thermoanaerobaculia bacterium]
MKSKNGPRLGIVNPTTLVGEEIKSILRERSFPYEKVTLLDSTGTAEGVLTEIGDEPAIVAGATASALEELDLVFFCGPARSAEQWIAMRDEARFIAIDLSQPSAAAEGKLVIAGMNLDEIVTTDDMLVSPHPIALPLTVILHQLGTVAAIDSCTATVIQPASEFDQEGVEELAQQTVGFLSVKTVPKKVFDRQLAFNLYPALERREEFIVSQIRGLTGLRAELALFITQGTIFHGHTFSLFVKTRDAVDVDRLTAALKANPIISFAEGDQKYGTIDAAGRDEILVAEVRQDAAVPNGYWIWAACDNLRRSSALNAVLVAEKVLFGLTPPN